MGVGNVCSGESKTYPLDTVYSLQRPGYSLACCSHLGQETDWQIVEIGIMVLRDDLCVPGPNRGNVKKGDDALSLKDDVSGYLPRGNPAKQAVIGCVCHGPAIWQNP
jgi:hypothetical protein